MDFQPVIGLEIHLQLKTKRKMFCDCAADIWKAAPNTHVCPVCLGLPGALPVVNKKAVEQTIKAGLALSCQVTQETFFERKHYFYPDLPKGYQISQYRAPLCESGKLGIRIRRVHLEEDTAKSIHSVDSTLLDFNKSGIPLLEIVSEPDIRSVEQAVEYSKAVRELVRRLGVSNADMEKGQMRLEANVSMSQGDLPDYRVEIKNINSFRFLEEALRYEIKRQSEVLLGGEKLVQETRGYDVRKGVTFIQRTKEEARDYRYFPEPDLPPLEIGNAEISKLRASLPKLKDELLDELVKTYGIRKKDAEVLSKDAHKREYFEDVVARGLNAQKAANVIINRSEILHLKPDQLIEYLERKDVEEVSNEAHLQPVVESVIGGNPQAVADLKSGKDSALKFLIGQAMRQTKGKADPRIVEKLLRETLDA